MSPSQRINTLCANRAYFDQMASTYQTKFADSMKIIAEQTAKHRLWISDRWSDTESGKGQELKMLEYACGPGVVSMTLAPFVTKVIGVDIADQMLAEFQNNAKTIGLGDKMIGFKADLLSDTAAEDFSGPEFHDFDVVAVSMSLHHFQQPDVALQRLASRLKKGGSMMIIDLVPSSAKEFGDAAPTVKTHGFTKEDMRKLFAYAGLDKGFDYEVIPDQLKWEKPEGTLTKTIFIARAQRG
ncbi:Uncharacterized protein PECH_001130 [Penicillium ucsense]|uniref:Methyltransferase domain-containing protein n=1 Tax=Penicillium ucsense TaxID=2839758 RepID=A0A8J8WG23_9EURO|nr:Uncharacterized protein PECM_000818 [Penicillium ucsense]KAF7733141.1 Uncharacterized protein PECH_001130 [Penicillium ucsense]